MSGLRASSASLIKPEFADEGADLEEAINNAFAFAERLLEAQRELTLNLVRTLLSDEQPIDPAG